MTDRKPAGFWTKENTIKEARLVLEKHGPEAINQAWLIKNGYGGLVSAVGKYGGMPWINKKLRLKGGKKSKGFWTKEKTIKQARLALEKHGPEAINRPWLCKNGYSSLADVIRRHGGYSWIRAELGLKEGKKSPGFWTKENTIKEARLVLEEHGPEAVRQLWLFKHGYSSLVVAIQRQGGLPWIRAELGLKEGKKPPGFWTKENTIKEARLVLEEHGPEAFSSSLRVSKHCRGLVGGIQKHGGLSWIRKELGLDEKMWAQVSQLEAIVVKEARAILGKHGPGAIRRAWLEENGYAELVPTVCRSGGFLWLRTELGLEEGPRSSDCRTKERAIEELGVVLKEHGSKAIWPFWLKENGYVGLAKAIARFGGSRRIREELGIKAQQSTTGATYRRAVNIERIKSVLRDLHIQGAAGFTPAQLIVLFQQSGLDNLPLTDGGDIFKRITKGSLLPKELIEWGMGEEPEPPAPAPTEPVKPSAPEPPTTSGTPVNPSAPPEPPEPGDPTEPSTPVEPPEQPEQPEDLPDLMVMDPFDQLRFLDSPTFAGADDEAIEALISMSLHQLWAKAYLGDEHEAQVVEACLSFHPQRPYSKRVQGEFLRQHAAARALPLPSSYRFEVDGKPAAPLLMQLHVAALAAERRRLLVLSAMGTGKSLAAQLAVLGDGAKRILVMPLNSCTHQWADDFRRDWSGVTVHTTAKRIQQEHDGQLTRVLETPQLSAGTNVWVLPLHLMSHLEDQDLAEIVEGYRPDAVIIDEVQFIKQRLDDQESTRREQSRKLLCLATAADPNLMVLALSGTAVVNNLTEARKLLELLLCEERPDLKEAVTPANAMKMHQALMAYGIRQKPAGEHKVKLSRPEVDASDLLDRIRIIHRARSSNTVLKTEQALLEAKLPLIVQSAIAEPTVIATQFVDGIVEPIYAALEKAGRRVGVYTGSEKLPCHGHANAVEAFRAGAVDVLVGSINVLGTGLDKLQHSCCNLVLATQPWTAADYQQLVARLARKGQLNVVKVTIPTTFIDYWSKEDGQVRWSYCDYRWAVIETKARLLDAVMDGLIPADSSELNASKAKRWIQKWMSRLEETGALVRVARPITVPLVFRTESEEIKARRHYGDWSGCNGRWNSTDSSKLHIRLQADPQEWELYHTDLEKLRLNWTVDPLQEAINFCAQTNGLVVGDFGCGTAQLAEALRGRHTVHSFDHIAINDSVVACDIAAGVPLEDNCLDYAVFSLSLMGRNWQDQLVEAWRCLKPTGQLLVWSAASSHGNDLETFRSSVEDAGFRCMKAEAHHKWLHLWAAKVPRSAEVAVAA